MPDVWSKAPQSLNISRVVRQTLSIRRFLGGRRLVLGPAKFSGSLFELWLGRRH